MKFSRSSKPKPNLQKLLKVQLPEDYPWKVLDALVDDLSNILHEDRITQVKGIIRNRDYTAYLGLSEEWGVQSTRLAGIKQTEMFAEYQVAALLKKYRFPSGTDSRLEVAKEKFLAAEFECGMYNAKRYKTIINLQDDTELAAFTYALTFLEKLLGHVVPEEAELTHWSRHGPGANLDTKLRRVSLYDKYSNFPYSCTQGALGLAKSAIQNDERWLGALEDEYRTRNNIPAHRILNQERFWSDVFHVVPGNRITFVPKNSQTDRSIAIEPCMNLYLQLGIDGYIRRRLKRWGIDLDSQEKNQRLAREGSLNWDDPESFVTLDLAAASDTISLRICKLLLPPQWYNHLMSLRSPTGTLGDDTLVYNKMSSMGNGFTFALESAIFAALIYGATRAKTQSFDREAFAVFGDDLIVRKSLAPLTVRMLNLAGFSVNSEKSFIEGPFRESCGADWFKGQPVRPVFLAEKPNTVMELWNDVNRLRRILSLRVWGFEFKSTTLISKWIPEKFRKFTGPLSDEDFDSYLHSPTHTVRYDVRRCHYKFSRLVARPKRLKGENFLMRKLMHPLRPETQTPTSFRKDTWGGLRLTGAGSVFTVTRANCVTVGHGYSLASYWQDEYHDKY